MENVVIERKRVIPKKLAPSESRTEERKSDLVAGEENRSNPVISA